MVLDPISWDVMPDPIETLEIFHKPTTPKPKASDFNDLPWDA
jgi:hypothetical protein